MSESRWYKCRLDEPSICGDWRCDVLAKSPSQAAEYFAADCASEAGQIEGQVSVIGVDGCGYKNPKRYRVKTWQRQMAKAEEVENG